MKSAELAKIADILPPPAPVPPDNTAGLYLISIAAILTIATWLILRRSRRGQFNQLRRLYQQQKINHRDLATRLDKLLCLQFHLVRISPTITPINQDRKDWQQLATDLQHVRFSHHEIDDALLRSLLDRTSTCLKRKP